MDPLQRAPENQATPLVGYNVATSDNALMEAVQDAWITEMAGVRGEDARLKHGDPAVADAYCASRLDGDWGGRFGRFGTLPRGLGLAGIVFRTTPHLES